MVARLGTPEDANCSNVRNWYVQESGDLLPVILVHNWDICPNRPAAGRVPPGRPWHFESAFVPGYRYRVQVPVTKERHAVVERIPGERNSLSKHTRPGLSFRNPGSQCHVKLDSSVLFGHFPLSASCSESHCVHSQARTAFQRLFSSLRVHVDMSSSPPSAAAGLALPVNKLAASGWGTPKNPRTATQNTMSAPNTSRSSDPLDKTPKGNLEDKINLEVKVLW